MTIFKRSVPIVLYRYVLEDTCHQHIPHRTFEFRFILGKIRRMIKEFGKFNIREKHEVNLNNLTLVRKSD